MDRIQATPRVNPTIGGLADLLAASYSPQRTQQLQGLMNFLGVPAVAQTLDRISYGEPITTGRGMTTELRPEAKSTLGALLGLVPIGRAAAPAAEAATMAAGRAGERVAERAVPRIMQGGGLPAEMLGAFGQNTQSRIFIGPEARTWDKDAAFRAARMEKQGATPEEIWAATGTARGPDKMWRQERSDLGATFRTPKEIAAQGEIAKEQLAQLREQIKPNRSGQKDLFPKELTEARRPLKAQAEDIQSLMRGPYGYASYSPQFDGNFAELAYQNPELYAAYPELARNIIIRQGMDASDGMRGSLEGPLMNVSRQAIQKGDAASTATHEMQHAIQEIERFGVGGNTRDFARMRHLAMVEIEGLNNQMTALVRQMDDPATSAAQRAELKKQYDSLIEQRNALVPTAQLDPLQAYGHLMGEAEARLVQRRMNLTPEQRRQNFPFQYTGDTGLGFDVDPTKMILMTPEGQILERGLLGSIGR